MAKRRESGWYRKLTNGKVQRERDQVAIAR